MVAPTIQTMTRPADISESYAGQMMAAGPVRDRYDAEHRVGQIKNFNDQQSIDWTGVYGHLEGADSNSYRLLGDAIMDKGVHSGSGSARPASTADVQFYSNLRGGMGF
jgi:hypothetical protein